MTLTELQETLAASQDGIEFSGEMKSGQLTNQKNAYALKTPHVVALPFI